MSLFANIRRRLLSDRWALCHVCQTSWEAGSCFIEFPVNKQLFNSCICSIKHHETSKHSLAVLTPHLLCLIDVEQCEPGWDKFHGFCYRHFSQRLSWEVAEQHCRMLGAHLVSIMTPEEQSYINSRIRPSRFILYEWFIYLLSLEDWI